MIWFKKKHRAFSIIFVQICQGRCTRLCTSTVQRSAYDWPSPFSRRSTSSTFTTGRQVGTIIDIRFFFLGTKCIVSLQFYFRFRLGIEFVGSSCGEQHRTEVHSRRNETPAGAVWPTTEEQNATRRLTSYMRRHLVRSRLTVQGSCCRCS